MKLFVFLLAAVIGMPVYGQDSSGNGRNEGTGGSACNSGALYSQPLCCNTDVLGAASLDCKPPSRSPNSGTFKSICSADGRESMCCSITEAGLALLCQPAV